MMTSHILVFTVLATLQYSHASQIVFNASETSIKPLLSSNMTVTCSLKDTTPVGPAVGRRRSLVSESNDLTTERHDHKDLQDSDDISLQDTRTSRSLIVTQDNVQFVLSITITKDGSDLATVNEHLAAHPLEGHTEFSVSGDLSTSKGDRGFLQLTWPDPTPVDAGSYTCEISTLSSTGHAVVFSNSLEIVEEDISFDELVSHVHDIKLEAKKTKSELEALKQVARTEPNILFSAVMTKPQNAPKHQTIIYDKIYANIGQGYNGQNGKFVAPTYGYYSFEVYTMENNGGDANLDLLHNGQRVASVLCQSTGNAHESCSIGVTIKLSKSDTVEVVAGNTWPTAYVYTRYADIGYTNAFSGRLVAID